LLGGWQTSFTVEGRPVPALGQVPSTDIARVSPDYFAAMGVPLLRGRVFTDQDREGSLPVCIVDESMASAYWPGEDPIGRRIRLGGPHPENDSPWMEVVGVVAHVKNYGVDQDSRVETYVPVLQNPLGWLSLVVRAWGEPTSLTAAIRQAVRSVDPEVPVYNVRTMEEILSNAVAGRRLSVMLLSLFAALALCLAAIGVYGVMSYSVTQRTHEIGIRMALGAQRRDVLTLVVREGMSLAAIGLLVGLLASAGLTRLIQSLLFRVSVTDPATFVGIPILLAAVACLASLVPARRAASVDPVVSLRYE
jgi:putative ABC transport system permease protein